MLKKIIVSICFIFVTNVAVFALESEELVYMNVYEKLNPAIVSIDAELPIGLSSGSGCIIDSDGTILTSSHVVENGKKIEFDVILTFKNENNEKNYVVYTDNSYDNNNKLTIYASIYNPDNLQFIGNPDTKEEWDIIYNLLDKTLLN